MAILRLWVHRDTRSNRANREEPAKITDFRGAGAVSPPPLALLFVLRSWKGLEQVTPFEKVGKMTSKNHGSWRLKITWVFPLVVTRFDHLDQLGGARFWTLVVRVGPTLVVLGGGNSNLFYFHPDPWGRWTNFESFWLIFFTWVETI